MKVLCLRYATGPGYFFMVHSQGGSRKSSPFSVLHVSLATVSISIFTNESSVFTLCYGPGLLFRGPLCIKGSSYCYSGRYIVLDDCEVNTRR